MLGRRHGADLPQPRRTRSGGRRIPRRSPAADEAATVAEIEAAFLALTDPNDWTGDGAPEGWKVIDRAFTKAEARYIPNGPGSTTDMAHPTRTGDLVVFSYPPYQFDAATPGTLIARSAFFGQHGYVPDVQDFAANINMRATFIAGGPGIAKAGRVDGMRTIDIAPTIAYLLKRARAAAQPGRGAARPADGRRSRTLVPLIGLNDFHGQLEPTTMTIDGLQRVGRRSRAAGHDVRRGSGAVPRRLAPARRR